MGCEAEVAARRLGVGAACANVGSLGGVLMGNKVAAKSGAVGLGIMAKVWGLTSWCWRAETEVSCEGLGLRGFRGCMWGVCTAKVGAGEQWPRCGARRLRFAKVADVRRPTGRSLRKGEEGAEVEWLNGGGLREGPRWMGQPAGA